MKMFAWLAEEIKTFCNALTFYTRLPMPFYSFFSEERLGRCTLYFSIIGWIVGAFGSLVFLGADFLFPKPIALMLSMVSTIWLTGAMHEDGFADFCDGFGGGWTKERILEIMKDSRLGTYGVIGLVGMLALKWNCLNEFSIGNLCFALVCGHSLSRYFSTSFMMTHNYVGGGPGSKAKGLCNPISKTGFLFITISGLFPLLLFRNAKILLCLIPLILVHGFLGKLWGKKIGGYTGDCLGAAQQISELVFYLFLIGIPWIFT